MARYRKNQTAQKDRRQPSVQNGGTPFADSTNLMPAVDLFIEKHAQSVSKVNAPRPVRRSARLNPEYSGNTEDQHTLPANKTLCKEARMTPRTSPDFSEERLSDQETLFFGRSTQIDPIDYWLQEQNWPKEYFKPDTISNLLAISKFIPSLQRKRKRSESDSASESSITPSDQKPREEKSAPYNDARYPTLLATKGSFMEEDQEGPTKASKDLCRNLLEEKQDVPDVSRFSDNVFKSACKRIRDRNEAKVIQDITRLIVPSAEELADFGSEHLECLVESVNEGWNNSIPVTKPRPQPDYSVGFKRTTFTKDQLDKLQPFIGDFLNGEQSFFMATFYMYFPFLTCEVKCGAIALPIADRQNAHSMTLAVRAIVELFRLVKREQELHRQILAFSISHNDSSMKIYGHYPVIDGSDIKYYRYDIYGCDFTALDGRDKWTAYKFTKNVYNIWMPKHLTRIRSIINELPSDFDFKVPLLPEESRLS